MWKFNRILLLMMVWVGCSRAPVLTIANHTAGALTNVVVSGEGFAARVDRIAAGAEHRLVVRPRGGSGVRIIFDAGSRHIDTGEQGYFEPGGGYLIAIIIQPDLKVSVDSKLPRY